MSPTSQIDIIVGERKATEMSYNKYLKKVKKEFVCIFVVLICIILYMGCGITSVKNIFSLEKMVKKISICLGNELDGFCSNYKDEEEQIFLICKEQIMSFPTVSEVEELRRYLRKIWVIDIGTEEEELYSTPFSFYITSVDNGIIEGKYQIGHGIILPECYQKGYKNGFKDRDEVGSFKGKINNGIIKCDFRDKNGNEGEIDFLLWEDACIKAGIKCTKSGVESENEEIDGTYCFRPYNLSDIKDITISDEHSFETELDSWGRVRVVSARLDNQNEGWYYPVAYLTDLEGNILYELYSGYKTGSEVSDVIIEDMNEDGLKDIGIITLFTIYADESDFYYLIRWNLYQMEDGRFYLNDSIEMREEK